MTDTTRTVNRVPGACSTRCHVLVPAHNEAGRIVACLDSLDASALPPSVTWGSWSVLDGNSDDATPGLVRRWAAAHPGRRVSLVPETARQGKAHALGAAHRRLVAREVRTDLVVVLDADTRVAPGALAALLTPFVQDGDLAVTYGVDLVGDCSAGRWASSFQMLVTTELARRLGAGSPRAYGRFFAYRLGALADFSWSRDQLDDVQLASFLTRRGLAVASVPGAGVVVTPARGWRDFYLQTYRYYEAAERERREQAESASRPPAGLGSRAAIWSALALTRRHPAWAGAYLCARAYCVAAHRLRPAELGAIWQPARSTKMAVRGDPRSAPDRSERRPLRPRWLRGQLSKLLACRRNLTNWPAVVTTVVLSHCGWRRPHLEVRSRSGVRLRAPNRAGVRDPLLEVLAYDAYRLGNLSWPDPARPRVVLDVGAHVGSFTCALAAGLPGARFTCVEPAPASRVQLEANLAANGLTGRASVVAAAVASSDGEVDLWSAEEGSCEASTVAAGDGRATRVTARSLTSLVAGAGGHVDVVKLDCEGAEYAAVLDSPIEAWTGVERVFLEHHPVAGRTFAELVARFREVGLHLVWHQGDDRDPELGMACFERAADPISPKGRGATGTAGSATW